MNPKYQQYFKNCIGFKQTQQGAIPLRFTEKQLENYRNLNRAREIRSLSPAGVCLDVRTDSEWISISYTVIDKARDSLYFDIYLDDVFKESIDSTPIGQVEGEMRYTIPQDGEPMKRITVYFPHNVYLIIKEISFSANARLEKTPAYQKNLLCLGDSITQGMEAQHPSLTYPVLLSRFFDINLLNQGVGGHVYKAEDLDGDLTYQPDIITVAYGTNNWGVCKSHGEFKQKCQDYYKKLNELYPHTPIYAITPLWRSNIEEQRPSGSFYDLIRTIDETCQKYANIHVIDGLKLVPHIPEFFGDKTLHPSHEGFLLMAANIAKVIGKVF